MPWSNLLTASSSGAKLAFATTATTGFSSCPSIHSLEVLPDSSRFLPRVRKIALDGAGLESEQSKQAH